MLNATKRLIAVTGVAMLLLAFMPVAGTALAQRKNYHAYPVYTNTGVSILLVIQQNERR